MQGAKEYFRGVYEETYHELLRYVVIKTRSAGDVEDILQNAYLKLYRRIQKRGYADIENANAFMMRVVQKELSTYYRFRLRKAEREQSMPAFEMAGASPDVEDQAINGETLRHIWRVIEGAPALSYKSFVLHYYFGMSVPEIARSLGLSEPNVTSRLYRVRQTLRSKLEKE